MEFGVSFFFFKNTFNFVNNFKTVSAIALIFHMRLSKNKTVLLNQDICPCDLGHSWNWRLSEAFEFQNTTCLDHKAVVYKV